MKRTLLSLLIVAMFTGAGTLAMAQNVTADDEPTAGERSGTQTHVYPEAGTENQQGVDKQVNAPGSPGAANQSVPNPDKNAASDKAQMEYKTAKEKCDNLKSSDKGACISAAMATRDEALKQARKQSKDKGAAIDSDITTSAKQQAEMESTDKDASMSTN